jgi:Kef-type K+ transport system membrane component KefB
MEVFFAILSFLVFTRLFGELAERLGLPSLVGELLSGVLLGVLAAALAGVVPALDGLRDSESLALITDFSMFFLMLLAGVEMEPRDMARRSGRAFAVAFGGMALPLGFGVALGLWVLPESPLRIAQAVFLGTALAVTAVPVTVRVFMDLGRLDTDVGRTVVSAALFDDILSLFILSLLIGMMNGEPQSAASIGFLLIKIGVFFAITIPIGWFVFPRVGRYFKHFLISEIDLSMLLIAAFAYAVIAELLGLHYIVGAFLAGVFFQRPVVDPVVYERVEAQLSGLTTGFLAPIFFASVGLHLDPSAFLAVPFFVVLLVVIAMLSKVVGAGLAARWTGMSTFDASMVGVGMSGRGAVELIIANLALQAGLFNQPDPPPPILTNMFSAVVIMAVVTTVATPILLRWGLRREGQT